jgi:hypothetical protein
MHKFTPHYEILLESQRDLWSYLHPFRNEGFALYGGTALALQIGHRKSVDFDFFSSMPLPPEKMDYLLTLPMIEGSLITQRTNNTLSIRTQSDVKISFFGDIHFGRIGVPLVSNDDIACVASIQDLFATKLATLMGRIEAKDYRDIAAIIRNGQTLAYGIGGCMALYGDKIPTVDILKALVYFEGSDLESLTDEEKNLLVNAVNSLDIKNIPHTPIVSQQLHI